MYGGYSNETINQYQSFKGKQSRLDFAPFSNWRLFNTFRVKFHGQYQSIKKEEKSGVKREEEKKEEKKGEKKDEKKDEKKEEEKD